MALEAKIKLLLEEYDIRPSEKLGQHFLVDEVVIGQIASFVVRGAHVIEVGSGTGHLTAKLAERASSVSTVEIDPRYGEILGNLEGTHPNIDVHLGNVLDAGLTPLLKRDALNQVVSNLPYHITEPFLGSMVGQPIENAVLLVGDNTARELKQSEASTLYGRMSLIAQTFFGIRDLVRVPKTAFFPQPRTDSNLIELTPKDAAEIYSNPVLAILSKLVTTAKYHGLVINVMKDALVSTAQNTAHGTLGKKAGWQKSRAMVRRQNRNWVASYNSTGKIEEEIEEPELNGRQIDQHQALGIISKMGIAQAILYRPFTGLDNQDLRELVSRIRTILR